MRWVLSLLERSLIFEYCRRIYTLVQVMFPTPKAVYETLNKQLFAAYEDIDSINKEWGKPDGDTLGPFEVSEILYQLVTPQTGCNYANVEENLPPTATPHHRRYRKGPSGTQNPPSPDPCEVETNLHVLRENRQFQFCHGDQSRLSQRPR